MRVTETMKLDSLNGETGRLSVKLMNATTQASTGVRVAAPSDDPVAYATMVRTDAMTSRITARMGGLNSAKTNLTLAEGALAQTSDLFTRARELAVTMGDDGAIPSDRLATANEIHALRDQALSFANAHGSDGYLFGGTKTDTVPFDTTGAFVGNDGVRTVEVAENVTAAGNASGAKAFTSAGGQDVFQTLSDLESAMRANDPVRIRASLGGLEAAQQQITAVRAQAGLGMERFTSAVDVGTAVGAQLQKVRADIAEVDAPSAYSTLVNTKAAYERSLDITKQILSLTSFTG